MTADCIQIPEKSQPIDIFISHSSRRDQEHYQFVNQLAEALRRRCFRVFLDRLEPDGQQTIIPWLDAVLATSRTGLVVLTKQALESGWVSFELGVMSRQQASGHMQVYALKMETDCPIPGRIRSTHVIQPNSWHIPDVADLVAKRLRRPVAGQPSHGL
jgi:hypothetical protein